MSWYDGKRDAIVTFALDVPTSNRLANRVWEDGCILKESVVDGKIDGIARLLEIVSREEVVAVYADSLSDLCVTFRKGAEVLTELRRHNMKIVFTEWEMNPLSHDYEAVLYALKDLIQRDSRSRSEAIKRGQRYSAEKYGRKGGRPRKKLPLKEIAEMRSHGLTWKRISKELDIPVMTMHDRKADIELYMKDYGMEIPNEGRTG